MIAAISASDSWSPKGVIALLNLIPLTVISPWMPWSTMRIGTSGLLSSHSEPASGGYAESRRLVTGSASGEQLSAVGRGCCTAGRDRSARNDGLGRVEVHDAGRLIGSDRSAVRVAAVGTATGGESDKRGAGREG